MIQKLFYGIILGVLFTSVVSVLAADTNDTERKDSFILPGEDNETISNQWHGGRWYYKNVSGSYSFVVTRVHGSPANRLYLQWWLGSEEDKELAYSVSVRELNETPSFAFIEPDCLNKRCDDLRLTTRQAYEGYKQVFLIELNSLGRYRIEPSLQ